MNIDKFGRSDTPARAAFSFRSSSAASFPKTRDGDYDLENLKLCNVGAPTLPEDAATKSYADEQAHSTLEAANKRLATEIQGLNDTCQEIREQADISNRLNVKRMVKLQNNVREEISAKYDEKLKSLWRALNAHIGSPEQQQGPTTPLATVPDV